MDLQFLINLVGVFPHQRLTYLQFRRDFLVKSSRDQAAQDRLLAPAESHPLPELPAESLPLMCFPVNRRWPVRSTRQGRQTLRGTDGFDQKVVGASLHGLIQQIRVKSTQHDDNFQTDNNTFERTDALTTVCVCPSIGTDRPAGGSTGIGTLRPEMHPVVVCTAVTTFCTLSIAISHRPHSRSCRLAKITTTA